MKNKIIGIPHFLAVEAEQVFGGATSCPPPPVAFYEVVLSPNLNLLSNFCYKWVCFCDVFLDNEEKQESKTTHLFQFFKKSSATLIFV